MLVFRPQLQAPESCALLPAMAVAQRPIFGVNSEAFTAERLAAGLSLDAFSVRLGISSELLRLIEHGHVPRITTQRRIAEEMGRDVRDLFPRLEPPASILEALREARGLTIEEVAAEIDIGRKTLAKAEANKRVALRVQRQISAFYGIPIAQWYKPEDEEVAA